MQMPRAKFTQWTWFDKWQATQNNLRLFFFIYIFIYYVIELIFFIEIIVIIWKTSKVPSPPLCMCCLQVSVDLFRLWGFYANAEIIDFEFSSKKRLRFVVVLVFFFIKCVTWSHKHTLNNIEIECRNAGVGALANLPFCCCCFVSLRGMVLVIWRVWRI